MIYYENYFQVVEKLLGTSDILNPPDFTDYGKVTCSHGWEEKHIYKLHVEEYSITSKHIQRIQDSKGLAWCADIPVTTVVYGLRLGPSVHEDVVVCCCIRKMRIKSLCTGTLRSQF